MRVALCCDGNQVSPHFGRCEKYLLAELEGTDIALVEWLVNPGHEPGVLPELMRKKGVAVVLAGGAGPRAQALLAAAGIEFVGGVSGEIIQVLAALAQGRLVCGESSRAHQEEG